VATLIVQNSKSVFRMQFDFEECTLQTNIMDEFGSLLKSLTQTLRSAGKEAAASYAECGAAEMKKFKEEVIQTYLGRPAELFGKSPRESKEFLSDLPNNEVAQMPQVPEFPSWQSISPRGSFQSQKCCVDQRASTHSTPSKLKDETSVESNGPDDRKTSGGRMHERFWRYWSRSSKVQPVEHTETEKSSSETTKKLVKESHRDDGGEDLTSPLPSTP